MVSCRATLLLLLPCAAWQPASPAPRRAALVAVRSAPEPSRPDADEPDAAEWSLAEDWAVRDSVDDFTAGSGDNARTFWAQLCAATPILARRSAREVEARHRSLAGAAHPSPPTLEEWSRAADGQFSGNLGGRTVWLELTRQ